jgi:hypothetical protein
MRLRCRACRTCSGSSSRACQRSLAASARTRYSARCEQLPALQ